MRPDDPLTRCSGTPATPDNELLDFMQKIMIKFGTTITLKLNGADFLVNGFGRTGYASNLREAIESLDDRIKDEISTRVLKKLES